MKDLDLGKLKVNRDGTIRSVPNRKRLSTRNLWLIGAALVIGVWLLWPKAVAVQATQVVTAWPSQQYVVLNATGYVTARRKAAVAPKGTGRVEWIGVNEGDFVKAGTVVARLEALDVEASFQAAKANSAVAAAAITGSKSELDDAQRNLDRVNILFGKKLMSTVNLQEAQSRHNRANASYMSAKASLEAARANELYAQRAVDYTQMIAPFDGVVISRNASVGDIVSSLSSAADAKGAAVVIADMGSLEVDADVSESSLGSIQQGQPCEIVLDAFPDQRFRGEVSVVVPTVNRASATVTTKVKFLDPDPKVLPDMGARVAFLSQAVDSAREKPVMAVNPEALVERDGKSFVYKLGADGRVLEVPVQAGAVLGGVRAIVGDLKVGDSLAIGPAGKLKDQSRVALAASK
ncbi:MAG: efflux RND transporter periplasmic adaptor subunit [Stagnimonas sp.]|nr:efflux RND transporter periplasmic adaptor subunit [Stagnimonas sp.]